MSSKNNKTTNPTIKEAKNRKEALEILKPLLKDGFMAKITSALGQETSKDYDGLDYLITITDCKTRTCRCCYKEKATTAFNGRKGYCKSCQKYSTYSESKIQIEFFQLVREDEELKNLPIFSVPNGGLRDMGTSRIMKEEGLLSGVWDILSLTPNSTYNGFIIETKALNGSTSSEQDKFENMVNPIGEPKRFDTYIMKNPKEGYRFVKEYLCR